MVLIVLCYDGGLRSVQSDPVLSSTLVASGDHNARRIVCVEDPAPSAPTACNACCFARRGWVEYVRPSEFPLTPPAGTCPAWHVPRPCCAARLGWVYWVHCTTSCTAVHGPLRPCHSRARSTTARPFACWLSCLAHARVQRPQLAGRALGTWIFLLQRCA